MSTETMAPAGEATARDDGVLRRTFAAELTAVTAAPRRAGRPVRRGRDGVADPPDWLEYDEEWMPGVFDHQLNAANRVLANFEHQQGIGGVVGHGLDAASGRPTGITARSGCTKPPTATRR